MGVSLLRLSASLSWVALVLLTAACRPAVHPPEDNQESGRPSVAKRLLVGIMGDPPTFSQRINTQGTGNIPGAAELGGLLNAYLSTAGEDGGQAPVLAEIVPSVANGLWQLSADGRMTTTWKLRSQASWHDGEPFTSQDLRFTAQLEKDRELPFTHGKAFDLVDAVESPDPTTVAVSWKAPYIYADTLFTSFVAPHHLLTSIYTGDKANFTQASYWTRDFVGTGPYRLREWVAGSHALIAAFDSYVLGRPNIDEIDVKFIPDPSALIANILSGSVDLTIGRSLSLDEALRLQDQ